MTARRHARTRRQRPTHRALAVGEGAGRAADTLIVLTPGVALLLWGGVRPVHWAVLAVLAMSAWLAARIAHTDAEVRGLPRAGAALLLFTGVAVLWPLIPVPEATVVALSAGRSIWASTPSAGLGAPPFLTSFHLAPGRGAAEALRWAALAAWGMALWLRRGCVEGKRAVTVATLATPVFAALLALASTLAGERIDLLDMDRPPQPEPLLAPLINANHFGTLVGMGGVVWADLAIRTRDRLLLSFGAFAVSCGLFAVVALSWSNGALYATGLSLAGLAIARWLGGRDRAARRAIHPAAAALAATATAGLGLAAIAWWIERLARSQAESLTGFRTWSALTQDVRLDIWRESLALLRSVSWTGVGRGAYVDAFARFQQTATRVRFVWAENEWLQAFVDHGVILGAAITAAALALLRTAVVRRAPSAGLGPAAALMLVCVHDLVDFSLQNGAVAMLAVAALVLAAPARTGGAVAARRASIALAIAVCACVGSAIAWRDCLHEDDVAATLRSAPGAELPAATQRAGQCFPASTSVATAAAEAWLAADQPSEAMQWASRALWLAPTSPWAHPTAARALRAIGAEDQALLEYRLALVASPRSPEVVHEIVPEVRRAFPGRSVLPDLVRRSAPADEAWFINEAWHHDPAAAADLAHARFGQGVPEGVDAVIAAIRAAWHRRDSARVTQLAEQVRALGALPARHALLAGVALASAGQTDGARSLFERTYQGSTRYRADAALELAKLAIAADRPGEARRYIRTAVGGSHAVAAEAWVVAATLDLRDGNRAAAERACRTAIRLDTRDVEATLMLAGLLSADGRQAAARELLEAAADRVQSPRIAEALATLRRSAP